MSSQKNLVAVFVCLFFLGGMALAQVTTGTILGAVSDSTGAMIPGATVTVRNVETGISRTVTSDAAGRYRAPQLGLGNYEVTAEVAGFQTTVRSGITLTVGREAVVDFALQVGAVAEKITVTGEAPLIVTTSSEVSSLVEGTTVREMPLNGRSYDQLVLLQPGVFFARPSAFGAPEWFGGQSWFSVGGARPTQSLTLLDGNSVNTFEYYAGSSVGGRNLGVDSIREFRLLSNNYSAEYGRTNGGILNVVTRSGTNDLHGSVFEFLRNSALDAKNFFDDPKGPIPAFKRNQFGGSLGGPIVKDRTFFFGVYEGLRDRLGVTALGYVPSLKARQGILPDKTVTVDPAVKPYLDLYPQPNGRELGGGIQEVFSSANQPTNENFWQVRIDHQISSNHSLFGRYTQDRTNAHYPYVRDQILGFPKDAFSSGSFATLQWTAIVSPTILNTARFGYSRNSFLGLATEAYPIMRFGWNHPRPGWIAVGGLTGLGTGSWMQNSDTVRNDFQYSDDINITQGSHSLKLGVLFERFRDFWYFDYNVNPYWIIFNIESFLSKQPFIFSGSLPGGDPSAYWRQWLYGFYFQDDWRVNPRLTLNLGLRYEPLNQATNANKRFGGLFGTINDILHDKEATLVKHPFPGNPTLGNLAPRFGFAWDVFGNGQTAVRGGFGITYEPMLAHLFTMRADTPPLLERVFYLFPSFPNPFVGGIPTKVPVSVVDVPDYNVVSSPSTMQFNLIIQRQLPGQIALQVGYVGSLGRHQGVAKNANYAWTTVFPDGRSGVLPENRGKRRNPNMSSMGTMGFFDGNSSYHSLQLGAAKSLSHDFMMNVNYTWSKAIDVGSGLHISQNVPGVSVDTQNPDCLACERGLSTFDRRHVFNASFSYALPLGPNRAIGGNLTGVAGKLLSGWEISGIATSNSGTPVMARFILNFDSAGNLDASLRPDLKAGRSNNAVLGDPDRWYDPSVFAVPPAGYFGNAGRNTITGPALNNFDFSLLKNTRWGGGEKKNLQFRAEFFNIFNHPNFMDPDPVVFLSLSGSVSPTAGRISRTANTSRQIQFGLKFTF